MNGLKLSDQQLVKLMTGLVDQNQNLPEAFSRSVWSLITEPGDRFAGALISTLGAKRALECELAKIPASKYIKLLSDAGYSDSSGDHFKNIEHVLKDARERWQPRLKLGAVEAMLNVAKHSKTKLITPDHEHWPEQLADLVLGVPHCLWLRGSSAVLDSSKYSMAIVGSRQATSYGEWVTTEIVSAASTSSIAIVSGGAYGIDAVAHRAALATEGSTIAIMAGGVDRLYPSGNSELLTRVIQSGAVISEQAPGSNPTKWRFLQRNRVIAAISSATSVVEAGKRSGAISTANHADDLNRPLGVVPGPINSPSSAGCHALIRDKQQSIVASVQDALNLVTGEFQPELFEDLPIGPLETRALDAMGKAPQVENNIANKAGLTARELIMALGRLQLLGLVAQGDRGWRKLT